MSLFAYILVAGVWAGAAEFLLYRWRRSEYRNIATMRAQAEALLREARLTRLRARAPHAAGAGTAVLRQRAS